MKYRKNTGYTALCILAAACLTGCGTKTSTTVTAVNQTAAASEEKGQASVSAEEVVNAYLQSSYDNYRKNIVYECEIEMGDKENVVASKTEIESDRAENYIYEVQSRSADCNGLESEYSYETYIVLKDGKNDFYTSFLDQDEWYKSSSDVSAEAMQEVLSSDDFKNASCCHDTEQNVYTVTVPMNDLSRGSDLFVNMLIGEGTDEEAASALEQAEKADGCDAVFTFSGDDMSLLSIKYDPVKYTYEYEEGSIACSGSMEIIFSDYGQVDEGKTKVSKKIVEKAESEEK